MRARVSNLESFRRWREDEDKSVADFLASLSAPPSPAMEAGTAFHKALELAKPGDYDNLYASGYTFQMPDCTLVLPEIRELRGFANYGPLQVTGCVDILVGKRIEDHKTTARFNAERYIEGYQWRFYLDLFGADVFRWNVFEIREIKPYVFEVADPQALEQHRYPGLHRDCERLAAQFYDVMSQVAPGYDAMKEAA